MEVHECKKNNICDIFSFIPLAVLHREKWLLQSPVDWPLQRGVTRPELTTNHQPPWYLGGYLLPSGLLSLHGWCHSEYDMMHHMMSQLDYESVDRIHWRHAVLQHGRRIVQTDLDIQGSHAHHASTLSSCACTTNGEVHGETVTHNNVKRCLHK